MEHNQSKDTGAAIKRFLKEHRSLLEIGAIILVLLLMITLAGANPAEDQPEQEVSENTQEEVVAAEEEAEEEEEEETAPAFRPAPRPVMTYEEVIAQYKGRRFQFSNCRGTPGSLITTPGVSFVIDNRDDRVRDINVAGRNYRLGAYGWRVVTSPGRGTHNITCDGGGAAQLIVQ